MDLFQYKQGRLFCESVKIADIADRVGTPCYIYSTATLRWHYKAIVDAFAELKPLVCFSIKSLSNLHILKLLAAEGSGFDIVSGGELARLQQIGVDTSRVAFAGVGKTDHELTESIAAGVGLFNVESAPEFENLSRLAAAAGAKVRAALRVNPDVYDTNTHAYTATGHKQSKFGVDIDLVEDFFAAYGSDPNVRLDGLHLHIGSPIYSPQPYVEAITKILGLIERLGRSGHNIALLDIGGGFAADYEEGASPTASAYADAIVPLLRGRSLQVVMEPGRSIVCNAGVLVTRVQYVKQGAEKAFIIVDAAVSDLIRPSLYHAEHFIYPEQLPIGTTAPQKRINGPVPGGVRVDVVGGVCESADYLAKNRILPPARRGDLLTVFSAGAYGFVMSSQYNSRPRAAEVLVDGKDWQVIRRRETYEDLFAHELNGLK